MANKVALELNRDLLPEWIDHGWTAIHSDVRELSMFIDNSFDAVIALDIIEHLEKEEGHKLLQEIDRICTRAAIVFTPYGFMDVSINQADLIRSPLDLHKSGWTPEELYDYGYDVYTSKFKIRGDSEEEFTGIIGVKNYDPNIQAVGLLPESYTRA